MPGGGAPVMPGGGAPVTPRTIVAKLADFGSARADTCRTGGRDGPLTQGLVTPGYQAPEAFCGKRPSATEHQYSFPMDVWSLGCILGELCCNKILFEAESDRDHNLLAAMVARLGMPPSNMQQTVCGGKVPWGQLPPVLPGMRQLKDLPCPGLPAMRPLAAECLQWDPAARPTAASCWYDLTQLLSATNPVSVQPRPEKRIAPNKEVGSLPTKEVQRDPLPPVKTAELAPKVVRAPSVAKSDSRARASEASCHGPPAEALAASSGRQSPPALSACQAAAKPGSLAQGGRGPRGSSQPAAKPATGGEFREAEPPDEAISQPDSSTAPQTQGQLCSCNGRCDQAHRYKYQEPCPNPGSSLHGDTRKTAGDLLCSLCACEFPGCNRQKVYYRQTCLAHAYSSLPVELQLVRAFSMAGVLEVALPCDIEVLLEPAVAAQISRNWMIELVAGWMKEPTAVRVWAAACAAKKAAAVTGVFLLDALHKTHLTQTQLKHCKRSTAMRAKIQQPTQHQSLQV